MKILSIISKSIKEQLRSFWILLLTLSMGPFFIFVYYLIIETSKPVYNIVFVSEDLGIQSNGEYIFHGEELYNTMYCNRSVKIPLPFRVSRADNFKSAESLLKERKADAVVYVDSTFSMKTEILRSGRSDEVPEVTLSGNLTDMKYLMSAVWAGEVVNNYLLAATGTKRIVKITEIPVGNSGVISDFDIVVPGLLILAVIMLMFTASIAFVSEVENKTIMRLKMSRLKVSEYITGITIVQLAIGLIAVMLTLATAVALGFRYTGSIGSILVIASLTSLSVIAFGLVIAAVTKSSNEVLVVGNFPMFLFMFFSGAAFPLKGEAWFTIAGYPVNLQSLMSPAHAISALNKSLLLNLPFNSLFPEIIAILILTALYFIAGGLIFNARHLKSV
jgi:ABC-2 type transport system permease protein